MHQSHIMNVGPSQRSFRDLWRHICSTYKLISVSKKIPESVDLRDDWWDISNQERTGSCAGWAIADSLLRYHFVKAGLLDKRARLSPRFIWMASKEIDSYTKFPTTFIELAFTSLKTSLDVAVNYGVVREDILPFHEHKLYSGTVEEFYNLASKYKICKYYRLGSSLRNWQLWIAQQGPVLFRIEVDDKFNNAFTFKNNGKKTKRLEEYGERIEGFGHAAVLVGYSPGTFIIRNSWGKEWGNDGFIEISHAYAKQALKETYGIEVKL